MCEIQNDSYKCVTIITKKIEKLWKTAKQLF